MCVNVVLVQTANDPGQLQLHESPVPERDADAGDEPVARSMGGTAGMERPRTSVVCGDARATACGSGVLKGALEGAAQ